MLPPTPHALRTRLSAFRKGEDGSITVEAVLILPLLLWAFLATFTYFDIYRAKSLALKANYAISDLLSREEIEVNMAYLNGLEKVYAYLTRGGEQAWVRVSVVWCNANCTDQDSRELQLDWSKATDSVASLSGTQIQGVYNDVIPLMALGERVIMVETQSKYTPPFSVALTGIHEQDLNDLIITRPRFSGQLCWQGATCSGG